MRGKATHRVLQSHNEPLLRQTKTDQTICAWWTSNSLTVEISVSCQLWESICFILHGTFSWGARHSCKHFVLFCSGFCAACSLSERKCWFACVMSGCVTKHLKNSDKGAFSGRQQNPTWVFFSVVAFSLASCKWEKVTELTTYFPKINSCMPWQRNVWLQIFFIALLAYIWQLKW